MSSTISIELERPTRGERHGAWEEIAIMRSYLYPDDTAEFASQLTLSGLECDEGDDRDTYGFYDGYRRLLDLLPPTVRNLLPPVPDGWDDAEATITILW